MKKKNKKISATPSTSKSQVRNCGINFRKIKIFAFVVLEAQVRIYELRIHEKKNKIPNPSTSKSQVQSFGFNFSKIKIFVFMVLKAQLWTCELRGNEKKKKKKKGFPQPPRH